MRLGDFSRKLWVVVRQIEIHYRKGRKTMRILQAAQTDLQNELRDYKTTRLCPNSVRDDYGELLKVILIPGSNFGGSLE